MIEAIPSPPYPLNTDSILMIEPSMRLRRAKIQSILPSNKYVTSQTAFPPRFGLDDFITPTGSGVDPDHSITRSIFIPDDLINPHPRFGTLVNNIRCRRGAKPFITIPAYRDKFTFNSNLSNPAEADWSQAKDLTSVDRFEVERLARRTINPIQNQIYMDCFAFGMGMSCVQTTFATPDVSSARFLYDQLAVLAPLFLALTASTPVLRGVLADTDTRWATLEQAVDCRTEEESMRIPKSRYSGVSLYISDSPRLTEHLPELNDTAAPIDDEAKALLLEGSVDEVLASHYAHLWLRDPLVIFGEKVELDDGQAVDHFENIQSTNWNSMRFKPPPPGSSADQMSPIGWRVEFRTPEIQLTDYDNAAGVALISVLAQMILFNGLDLYIPMSKNDDNMTRSWNRNAVTEETFWFRHDISNATTNWDFSEMTLHQVLTGDIRELNGSSFCLQGVPVSDLKV
ncbi:uncharacterized protein LOC129617217 [Condylostylus longicornis]|uniref:uncharacterized protein LOC129617217 n=1 Tax=Condylostylus longicornis TaxID=2530218 RepID=UPI00244DF110|nr:uncharacterized protein LOC129617217 [Condylostylus longicornis]